MEKTPDQSGVSIRLWKHLHGRGEDSCPVSKLLPWPETPPRTWRRQGVRSGNYFRLGNTSTDVEKTAPPRWVRVPSKKHLHGRGEDLARKKQPISNSETPPRTWRRRTVRDAKTGAQGNTSTDVEKTRRLWHRTKDFRKHLHGRGEDSASDFHSSDGPETPPRTWRRRCSEVRVARLRGNTSTDVEKTKSPASHQAPSRKHLHGRGEDAKTNLPLKRLVETPPRTWRRQLIDTGRLERPGNTSTDVEKTEGCEVEGFSCQKHLHGRGEDERKSASSRRRLETPPRTWRRPPGPEHFTANAF